MAASLNTLTYEVVRPRVERGSSAITVSDLHSERRPALRTAATILPVSTEALNATVPLSLKELTPKLSNGPLLSTMVVIAPPLPVKMPLSPVPRSARNATVPLSLRDWMVLVR